MRIRRSAKTNCCNGVIPCNAARPFNKPASILSFETTRRVIQRYRGGKILELGAGCLRNALYLQEQGFNVHVVEAKGIEHRFPEQYTRFRKAGGKVYYTFPNQLKYNLAVATFVIETICNIELRNSLLLSIAASLKEDGALIISVRGPSDLVTATASGIKCSDGFITPSKTFARAYTRTQLDLFLKRCGYKTVEFLHKKDTKQPEYLHAIAWKRSI